METTPNPASSSSLHPVLWVAAISVTLLSLAGIASLAGFLPAKLAPEPQAIVAAAPVTLAAPQNQPVVAADATAADATAAAAVTPKPPALPARKTPLVRHRKTAKVDPEISATSALLPPPLGSGVPPDYVAPPSAVAIPVVPPPCSDCGVIANVSELTHEGEGSGAGAILGGILGGAVANNLGQGNGRTLATIVGAVGGGLVGNSVEKSQHRTVSYRIVVRMEDGTTQLIDSSSLPPWRIGEQVKVVGRAIVPR